MVHGKEYSAGLLLSRTDAYTDIGAARKACAPIAVI